MSHIPHSPEFRLARTDSKNPATTCQGLTANGQKCRRTVVSASTKSKSGLQTAGKKCKQTPERLFCWQHQSQLTPQITVDKKQAPSQLRKRSSLDTIVERVGMLNIDERQQSRIPKQTLASGPVTSTDRSKERRVRTSTTPGHVNTAVGTVKACRPAKKPKKSGMRLVCFLTPVDDDDDGRPVVIRVKKKPEEDTRFSGSSLNPRPAVVRTPPKYVTSKQHRPAATGRELNGRSATSGAFEHPPSSHLTPQDRRPQLPPQLPGSSQTQYLLSLIPSTLSPEVTSKLLQKLAEPLSRHDEPGYIYVYCVTPSDSYPRKDVTPSLIPPPSNHQDRFPRRISDVMSTAGIAPTSEIERYDPDQPDHRRVARTITLKIGRAVNVSRRLGQQCSQNLTLVRYYPYHPSSSPGSPNPTPAASKAPNIHRLERLVHIELDDIRVKPEQPCERCGKKHQEFFEIEADTTQLRRVDECVKRWVEYSRRHPVN